MMPELFLADALGATGKPLLRVHTAGSVGGSTALVAASLVQPGVHQRVLTLAFEKQSESNAMWALSMPIPVPSRSAPARAASSHRTCGPTSGARARPTTSAPSSPSRTGATARKNPYAHLHEPDITLEKVQAAPMLWDPIRYDETCPSSDGACAMVITDRTAPTPRGRGRRGLDPRHRHAHRTDRPSPAATRSTRRPAATLQPPVAGRRASPTRRRDRRRRDLRPVLLVRADVAGEPRVRSRGRGLEAHRGGRHGDRRAHPGQPLGRRALVQPDRRIRHDPVRRGRHAGDGPGGRPPGRRVPARRSATRTAAAHSTTRCGSSSADKP